MHKKKLDSGYKHNRYCNYENNNKNKRNYFWELFVLYFRMLNNLFFQQTYVTPTTTELPMVNNSTINGEKKSDDTDSTALAIRRGPEGKDNDSFLHEDVDKDSGILKNYFYFHIYCGARGMMWSTI